MRLAFRSTISGCLIAGVVLASSAGAAPLAQGSDDCATPQVIAGLGIFPFDLTTATTGPTGQGEALCFGFGTTGITNDVWFSWAAPSTGSFTFTTCGATTVDTKMAIYPGSGCPAPGSAIDCNDDDCGLQSTLQLNATVGSTYTLQLGNFPGASAGTGTFEITGTAATTIPAGSDLWNTPGLGCTYQDFSGSPIPAGFFGGGSQPFTGFVGFVGRPLNGTGLVGGADTIVERLNGAQLNGCGTEDTVPLRVIALSMRSFQPITVQFGGGVTSSYDVTACLSSNFAQPNGLMTIRQEHANGGTFDSIVPVVPKLHFQRIAGTAGVVSATLDGGTVFHFQNPPPGSGVAGCWAFTGVGLGTPASPGGTADHDCDPTTPAVPFAAMTPNFFTGVCYPGADCANPGGPPEPTLTEEATALARHCILPVGLPPEATGYCYCPLNHPPFPPCGNSDPDAGCANGTGSGAALVASGPTTVSPDMLRIEVSGGPSFQAALLIQGSSAAMGQFGNGHLCITGNLLRLKVKIFSATGSAAWGHGEGESIAALGMVPPTGGTRYYQVWYRDPGGPCSFGVNLSNAWQVTWIP